MPQNVRNLTRAFVESVPLVAADAETGTQSTYYDEKLKGFRLVVGKHKKTFAFVGRAAGKDKKEFVKLGVFGQITVDEARRKARSIAGQMADGVSVRAAAKEQRSVTLREAWEDYRREFASEVKQGERSARTLRDYEQKLGLYLADWMDEELVSLGKDRRRVKERHQQITAGRWPGMKTDKRLGGRTRGGRAAANSALRVFRAVYRRAMKEDPTLPEVPTVNVRFHREKPREAALDDDLLRRVYRAILQIENPIRRDYWLLLVFTGLRRTSAAEIRWQDVNFDTAVLHIPNPKGGRSKKFDLPLSAPMLALFKRRRDGGRIPGLDESDTQGNRAYLGGIFAGSEWVFPALRRDHLTNRHKVVPLNDPRIEEKKGDVKTRVVEAFPHALRHTFNTNGLRAGVHPYDLKLLMNHAKPSSTTDMSFWYYRPSLDALRISQERISEFVLSLLRGVSAEGSSNYDLRASGSPL